MVTCRTIPQIARAVQWTGDNVEAVREIWPGARPESGCIGTGDGHLAKRGEWVVEIPGHPAVMLLTAAEFAAQYEVVDA